MSQWSMNAVHNASLMLTRRSTETDFAIKLIPIQQTVLLENTHWKLIIIVHCIYGSQQHVAAS